MLYGMDFPVLGISITPTQFQNCAGVPLMPRALGPTSKIQYIPDTEVLNFQDVTVAVCKPAVSAVLGIAPSLPVELQTLKVKI